MTEQNLQDQTAEQQSPPPATDTAPEPAAEAPEDQEAPAAQAPAAAPAAAAKDGAAAARSSKEMNLDTLLKVPVSLSIEVGRTRMLLSDLLATREGSVIELERLLDEPLDILVNGALIAHGVVVLANDRFGIQITDIVSRQDRAKSL